MKPRPTPRVSALVLTLLVGCTSATSTPSGDVLTIGRVASDVSDVIAPDDEVSVAPDVVLIDAVVEDAGPPLDVLDEVMEDASTSADIVAVPDAEPEVSKWEEAAELFGLETLLAIVGLLFGEV